MAAHKKTTPSHSSSAGTDVSSAHPLSSGKRAPQPDDAPRAPEEQQQQQQQAAPETLSPEHLALATSVEGDSPAVREQRLQAHRVWRAGLQATEARQAQEPARLVRPSPVVSGVSIDGQPLPRQRVERVVRTPKGSS